MTPAQLKHLRKIDAHLEKLLSQAEKRTPGRWEFRGGDIFGNIWAGIRVICGCPVARGRENATFIASCAGNTEAGWKATRAAIAAVEYYSIIDENLEIMVEAILAAFPLELIEE
jgi:hypothetical protein